MRLYYYRDKEGNEIEPILEQNGILYPIEIKRAAIATKDMVKSFGILEAAYPYAIGSSAVICNASNLGAINKDTLIIPVSLI